MQKKQLVICLVFSLIFLLTFAVNAEEKKKIAPNIIYVALDDRPVNLSYVQDSLADIPAKIIVPPAYMPVGREKGADVEQLWQWVNKEASKADIAVLSTDTLIYGGLVPSRLHQLEPNILQQRMEKFIELKKKNPRLKIYLFSTVLRSPKMSKGGVEPEYYSVYGPKIFQLTSLQAKEKMAGLSEAEKQQMDKLAQATPAQYLQDWLQRREKNFHVNQELIELTKKGIVDYFILGRDDTAVYTLSTVEYQKLAKQAESLYSSDWHFLHKFSSFCGVDDIGILLLGRAFNNYRAVKVYPLYAPGVGGKTIAQYEDQAIEDNVRNHIFAAGAVPTEQKEKADLFLFVNTPANGLTLEANNKNNSWHPTKANLIFANEIEKYLQAGKKVALADVAFSNGADNGLLSILAQKKVLPQLRSYAGWNTAGNSIGYALGQGLLADYISEEKKNKLLTVRLLDDWAYQANIRAQLNKEIIFLEHIDSNFLDDKKEKLEQEAKNRIDFFAVTHLSDFAFTSCQVRFPWQRMFEIEVILP